MMQKPHGTCGLNAPSRTAELATDMSNDYHNNDQRFNHGERCFMNILKGDRSHASIFTECRAMVSGINKVKKIQIQGGSKIYG